MIKFIRYGRNASAPRYRVVDLAKKLQDSSVTTERITEMLFVERCWKVDEAALKTMGARCQYLVQKGEKDLLIFLTFLRTGYFPDAYPDCDGEGHIYGTFRYETYSEIKY